MRVNGFLTLVGVVVMGMGSGAAYFHYKAPKLAAEMEARIAAAPKTPEGRVQQWLLFGGPQIHHRLTKFARFSPEEPWLVTHAVETPGGGDPEIWGIDCDGLGQDMTHVEGLTVVVELPEPRLLGRAALARDQFNYIPLYRPGEAVPDPAARLRELALYLLGDMPKALARDIPGASIEIRIGTPG